MLDSDTLKLTLNGNLLNESSRDRCGPMRPGIALHRNTWIVGPRRLFCCVWTRGYWNWNGVSYVWVPGRYVAAPFPDAVWIGGRWVARGHAWTWVDEHWRHR